MSICIVLMSIFLPRVTLFAAWIVSDWFRAFETWYWPLLGFICVPRATLVYMWAVLTGNQGAGAVILFCLAVFCDLFIWSIAGSKAT
jgi:hypothetical protein